MNDELELKWQETFWKQLFVKGVDDQLKNNCAKVEAKEYYDPNIMQRCLGLVWI